MKHLTLKPQENIDSYVNDIWIFEEDDISADTCLPFYADGFPGLLYLLSENDMFYNPGNKKLTKFFIYGQTIHPIELLVKGPFKMIIFQFYPLALKYLFGLNPKKFNDDCFDLSGLKQEEVKTTYERLSRVSEPELYIDILSSFLSELIEVNGRNIDDRIQMAVNKIITAKGKTPVKKVREEIHMTERTFERQFTNQVGITPKQFAKIIQFQFSFDKISKKEFQLFSDIVFESGFADQSHFIKSFKHFTGRTPSEFLGATHS